MKNTASPFRLRATRWAVLALLAASSGSCLAIEAKKPGSMRTDLQRHDLSTPGREVVQVRVDFDPGYTSPRHRHPGEEVIYVLAGSLEYHVEGRPPDIYRAGDVLTVPSGTFHWVRNIGDGKGAELATYIVEKDKPLIELGG